MPKNLNTLEQAGEHKNNTDKKNNQNNEKPNLIPNIITGKEVTDIINKLNKLSLNISADTIPQDFQTDYEYWCKDSKPQDCQEQISITLDKAAKYMQEKLGIKDPKELKAVGGKKTQGEGQRLLYDNLTNDGNIQEIENISVIMIQIIYSLEEILKIKNQGDERYNLLLQEFLCSDVLDSIACNAGTINRLNTVLNRLIECEPQERIIQQVTEEHLKEFCNQSHHYIRVGNQAHHNAAIMNRLGFDDMKHEVHAFSTSFAIPSDTLWHFQLEYLRDINKRLEEKHLTIIDSVNKILKQYPLNISPLNISENWNKAIEQLSYLGMREEDVHELYDLESEEWHKDVEKTIRKIFGLPLKVMDSALDAIQAGSVPKSLFDPQADQQIATLICSTEPSAQTMGILALSLIGNIQQQGSSPIQFFNIICQIGRIGSVTNSIELFIQGIEKLDSIKKKSTNKKLQKNIGYIHQILETGDRSGIYINQNQYLTQQLSLTQLLVNNAPVHIIQECITQKDQVNDTLRYLTELPGSSAGLSIAETSEGVLTKLIHNKGILDILPLILEKTENKYQDKIISCLVSLAAAAHKPEIIEAILEITGNTQKVQEGLLAIIYDPSSDIHRTGLEILVSCPDVKKMLGNIIESDQDTENKSDSNQNKISADILLELEPYLKKLATLGNSHQLEAILNLIPLSKQKVLSQIPSLLLAAAYTGRADIIRLLLNKGVDVNLQDEDGETALISAAEGKNQEIIKLLLNNGAEVTKNILDKIKNKIKPLAQLGNSRQLEAILSLIPSSKQKDMLLQMSDLLLEVVKKGHTDIVKLFLDKGVNVNLQNSDGRTSLMEATLYRNKEIIKLLLERDDTDVNLLERDDTDVNLQDNDGWTALKCAIMFKNEEGIKLFLKHHAELFIPPAKSPITEEELKEVLKKLINNGILDILPQILGETKNNEHPYKIIPCLVSLAAAAHKPEIIERILEIIGNTQKVQEKVKEGLLTEILDPILNQNRTGLEILASCPNVKKMLGNIIENDEDQENKGDSNQKRISSDILVELYPYLKKLIVSGSSQRLKAILNLILSNKQKDILFQMPDLLSRAVRNGIRLLSDKGVNVNLEDHDGNTDLTKAVLSENQEIIELLLNNGAKVTKGILDKIESLSTNRHLLKKTLNLFPLIKQKDILLQIPSLLLEVARSGHIDTVRLFLDKGVYDNVNLQDKDGRTAFMYAVTNNAEVTKLFLKKYDIDVNLQDNTGKTALHYIFGQFGGSEPGKMIMKTIILNQYNKGGEYRKALSKYSSTFSSVPGRLKKNIVQEVMKECVEEGIVGVDIFSRGWNWWFRLKAWFGIGETLHLGMFKKKAKDISNEAFTQAVKTIAEFKGGEKVQEKAKQQAKRIIKNNIKYLQYFTKQTIGTIGYQDALKDILTECINEGIITRNDLKHFPSTGNNYALTPQDQALSLPKQPIQDILPENRADVDDKARVSEKETPTNSVQQPGAQSRLMSSNELQVG